MYRVNLTHRLPSASPALGAAIGPLSLLRGQPFGQSFQRGMILRYPPHPGTGHHVVVLIAKTLLHSIQARRESFGGRSQPVFKSLRRVHSPLGGNTKAVKLGVAGVTLSLPRRSLELMPRDVHDSLSDWSDRESRHWQSL